MLKTYQKYKHIVHVILKCLYIQQGLQQSNGRIDKIISYLIGETCYENHTTKRKQTNIYT